MRKRDWIFDLLLIVALLLGAWFRSIGLDWDQGQHLHPDERFLTMVESALDARVCRDASLPLAACPPEQKRWLTLAEYFDTARSPLNPHNRGYGFYVYGDLPIVLVNVTAEWLTDLSQQAQAALATNPNAWYAPLLVPLADGTDWTGYGGVHLVGRQLSALFDLLSILLLYAIAARVYDRRVGLLAALFSALAVLQIQQSHFFTVDTFANFFIYLALWFAVRVWEAARDWDPAALIGGRDLLRAPLFWRSLWFGLALGMAMASKLNAAPMAILLPAAFALALWERRQAWDRREWQDVVLPRVFIMLVAGGLATLLAFRVFQPYAFTGLLTPNPQWLQNLADLRAQASGDADVPFALQWARRSHLFSFKNLTLWGLGLPLGVVAWLGVLSMGWRILRGEWQRHGLLWGWTVLYFTWQSLQFNPTMRYQLPIYPLLALMAAWFVLESGGWLSAPRARRYWRGAAWTLGALALLGTALWAWMFTRIYTREHTRVQATRWIYANLPGAVTPQWQAADGSRRQWPLPFPNQGSLTPEMPYTFSFRMPESGRLDAVYLPHVRLRGVTPPQIQVVLAQPGADGEETWLWSGAFDLSETPSPVALQVGEVVDFVAGDEYILRFIHAGGEARANLCRAPLLTIWTSDAPQIQAAGELTPCELAPGESAEVRFRAAIDGVLSALSLDSASAVIVQPPAETLTVQVTTEDGKMASAQVTADFGAAAHPLGDPVTLTLNSPLALPADSEVQITLTVDRGALALTGAAPANESTWDDGLPLRMEGFDGFGGLYAGGLNLELYWDDNADKLARFQSMLDQADYIFISSNRQWGTIPRVPERYPLTTAYYRALLGCPDDADVLWCYNVAKPGMFDGQLGFELVQVFESFPTLTLPGGREWRINDQFAEEAFTVYDHPKVLIFRKQADYDPQQVAAILGAVDLSQVVHLTPRQAGRYEYKPLVLTPQQQAVQQAGGTWSELFDYNAWQNRWPLVTVLLWYFFVALLGWLTYPIVRLALPGLGDRGYPLARLVGLLLLAWFSWLAGSLGLTYTRPVIAAALGLLALLGLGLGWRQRKALRDEWQQRKGYFLRVEALFLALFLFDLLIRLGNPDLWHPSKGGERPMDFSYLNAVLKSTIFPPYDPWFAGGYINYYYYGFVLVGTPVKLLGIVPAIAYNLILPTWFALLGTAAFSLGWNLLNDWQPQPFQVQRWRRWLPWIGGAAALSLTLLLGNLGTIQMIWRGLQRMAAPGGVLDGAGFFRQMIWAAQGLWRFLQGGILPFAPGDWYWFPSRVIPAPGSIEPITEFPLFTFIYSDLHAHMIALPITVLVIGWTFSVVRARARWESPLAALLGFWLGGLAVGTLRPTNTWDYPTYLLFALFGLGFALWQSEGQLPWLTRYGAWLARGAYVAVGLAALFALAKVTYAPFDYWFGSAYNSVGWWNGPYSPLPSYLVHWGLFVFILVAWLTWETREWLDNTPLSALEKLRPWRWAIETALAVFVAVLLGLTVMGISVVWLAWPLAVWAGVLILRADLPDSKRLVLFMVGTAALLTLVVEVVVLRGDIGRMNTVFKFYLQAWTLFALASGAAFAWTLADYHKWLPKWATLWETGLMLLVVGAFSFTMMGTLDKVRDRWTADAPHTLDSMAYMPYAQYADFDRLMTLDEDYRAIRWMQENIQGSPVIVEANTVEYHWGTRYTIYTGLPGVVGWNWHQRQQRALLGGLQVEQRVTEVHNFYNTPDAFAARDFLKKYGVRYIIVGQLERAEYAPDGIAKFERMDGWLWREVYRDGQTVIYEVR